MCIIAPVARLSFVRLALRFFVMSEDAVAAVISALGEAIGIPALRPDARGCCRLLFDGDQVVEVHPAPAQGRWLLSCVLRGRRADGLATLQVLMQGNHMGAGFGGGWAALDAQGQTVVHLPLPWAEASAPALLQAIELLLQHAERWTQRLSESAASPAQHLHPHHMASAHLRV